MRTWWHGHANRLHCWPHDSAATAAALHCTLRCCCNSAAVERPRMPPLPLCASVQAHAAVRESGTWRRSNAEGAACDCLRARCVAADAGPGRECPDMPRGHKTLGRGGSARTGASASDRPLPVPVLPQLPCTA